MCSCGIARDPSDSQCNSLLNPRGILRLRRCGDLDNFEEHGDCATTIDIILTYYSLEVDRFLIGFCLGPDSCVDMHFGKYWKYDFGGI